MAGQTQDEREAIFLANTMVENQPSREAAGVRRIVRSRMIACQDCGEKFAAKDLDMSTGLCELCYEAAGFFNEYQDDQLTWEEYVAKAIGYGYKGRDISAEERAAYAAREDGS